MILKHTHINTPIQSPLSTFNSKIQNVYRMGSCLSSGTDIVSSALIITPSGELLPYSTPVFVSDVLQTMDSSAFFLCNSDNLSYDEHITPMSPKDELDAAQIYFILPVSKLRGRLGASEMAALAVKASVALGSIGSKTTGSRVGMGDRKKKSKVSPFVVMESTNKMSYVMVDGQADKRLRVDGASTLGVSRSGSVRRMNARKARLGVRSFRLRLSTIYETDQSHKNSDRL